MTYINILIVAIWKSRQDFREYGRGNIPRRADKLPISHNNVVGDNTVLQLNILETGVLTLTRGSEFISNSTSSRLRCILSHSCENNGLLNVSVENLQLLYVAFL